MAASEVSLDNETLDQLDMQGKLKTWIKRESSGKTEADVQPNKEGEWLLITVDCSQNKPENRVEWIFGPANPGPLGKSLKKDEFGADEELEENVKNSLKDGIFAMKCLANGKRWAPGTVNDSAFGDLEDYVFCMKKKDKVQKPKKGKGVPSMLIASVKDQIMYISCSDMNKTTPRVRMQWARSYEGLKNLLNVPKKALIEKDNLQDLSVEKIIEIAAGLAPKV